MSQIPSRRDVVTRFTAAAAAVIHTRSAFGQNSALTGTIDVRQTAGARRLAPVAPVQWKRAHGSSAESVVLDPERPYQELLGFGAALTDSSCYILDRLEAPSREKLFREFFHPAE